MESIYLLEAIKLPLLGVTETADSAVQIVHYISHPFFSTLSICLAVCTCVGAVIYACKPAFVNPVLSVRMAVEDEVDLPIMLLFVHGLGLSLALLSIPTLTQIHLVLGLILFSIIYLGGGCIGILAWGLFQVAFLRIVRRDRNLSPWTTIRQLRCQDCTKPLHLIAASNSSKNLLSDYLSPIEQVAATGGTRFAIWHCSRCHPTANRDSVHIRGYRCHKAVVCPRCQETTMRATGSHRTWTNDEENEVTTYICKCCSAERSTTRFIQGGYLD